MVSFHFKLLTPITLLQNETDDNAELFEIYYTHHIPKEELECFLNQFYNMTPCE